MVWKTALACGPRTRTNCTVVYGDQHYNLSPLTRYSENYVIRTGTKAFPKIMLNVCHSIIRQYGVMCPSKTGVCLDDPKKSNKYVSI